MEKFNGKSIFNGIAIGNIYFYSKDEGIVVRTKIKNTQQELTRYAKAKDQAICELHHIYEKALKEVGEVNASVFEVHAMMLEDDEFNDSVENIINTQMVNAEYAVATTGDNFYKMFSEMDDEYFRARAADIKDISERVINILMGKQDGDIVGEDPVIVVAQDLVPSETVQMDKNKLLAFVTELGSANSHTAILARTMNIPALIGIPIQKDWNGRLAIVDGFHGELVLDPDEKTLLDAKNRQLENEQNIKLLQQLKGKDDCTIDGKKIKLYANIGSVSDVTSVLKNDAAGIGLFRSEFLYLEANDFPDETTQFQAYKTVLENMAGKKVIIRTLDIGADKQASYFNLMKEENPAMGYRAIRICLKQQDIFKTQLRALYRASAFGNLAIMFPMIISVNEVVLIKKIIHEVKEELTTQGIHYGKVEIGIMIETPAAVIISDLMSKEVDFFSIGTNDLTQYTLAIDRQNALLDDIYDPHHEAILRMIQMVIDHAHANNCWVGICGELGADMELTKRFIEMGIDELSVSPTFILPIRKIIREIDLAQSIVHK